MSAARVEPDLSHVAHRWADGEADIVAVADAFLDSSVFVTRTGDDQRPGVWASGPPGRPTVCAFTSLTLLAQAVARRPDTPATYLTTTGADLLSLLPTDCGVVVDALGPATVLLPYAVLRDRLVTKGDLQ